MSCVLNFTRNVFHAEIINMNMNISCYQANFEGSFDI